MIAGALDYLIQGLESLQEIQEYVKTTTGKELVITTNVQEANAPCIWVQVSQCKYAMNGGRGVAEFTVTFLLPFYDSSSYPKIMQVVDMVGGKLYFSAGRGATGHRITGVSLQGIEQGKDPAYLWALTFSIIIER